MAKEAGEKKTGKWLLGATGMVEGEIMRENDDFVMVRLKTDWNSGHWVFQVGDVIVLDKSRLRKVDGYWELKEIFHVPGDLV